MLQILLGGRVQFGAESLLGLKRTSLRFGDLIDFEATAHGRVHHYFAGSLDLLQRIQCDIVQITGAV